MASLNWPKRRLYMYMIPVAIISISANIPEIHSVMGHFLGFKVTFDKWKLVLFYIFRLLSATRPMMQITLIVLSF